MTLMKFFRPINFTSSMFSVLYRLMRTLSSRGSHTKKVMRMSPGSMMSQDLKDSERRAPAAREWERFFMDTSETGWDPMI